MATQAGRPNPRALRVFVSSTFRDMKEDRDYLIKFVFPQLRALCEARAVTWTEVDLRWGITDEEQAEGRVLPLCLEEVERSRPYFIGLLGERYGWIPEEFPSELVDRHPWLRANPGRSVTELEIIHGAFSEASASARAFFYFRDPASAGNESEPESPDARGKLARLKERIRAAHKEKRSSLRENYHGPEELGRWLLDDFRRLIDELFPAGEEPDPGDRETAGHMRFAESRARFYVGRPRYDDRLDAHVASEGPPLVIVGESGIGKSALLANWFVQHRERHPHEFALIHFLGRTPASTNPVFLMRRILFELKRRFDIPFDVPEHPDVIREVFLEWLEKTAASERMVLVLDGLDQLEKSDGVLDLDWLPLAFPSNCRVILSTLPSRSIASARRWPEMSVPRLTSQERKQFLEQFLAHYGRRLNPARVEHIVSAEQCGNPLFLHALLDELRQFGEHERLGERIEYYMAAANPRDLHERIARRWESDYSAGRSLVREALGFIWAARHGLSEVELLDLLGTDGQPLPRGNWTPLLLATGDSIANHDGLLNFAHAHVRDGVRRAFVSSPEVRTEKRLALARYFQAQESLTDRVAGELPWLLHEAGEWRQLAECIAQIPMFVRMRHSPWAPELLSHWAALGDEFNCEHAYTTSLAEWEAHANIVEQQFVWAELGIFFLEAGRYAAAEALLRKTLRSREKVLGERHRSTTSIVNALGAALTARGDIAGAEPLLRRALAEVERQFGSDHWNTVPPLTNLAEARKQRGDYKEAEVLYRRALAALEAGRMATDQIQNNLGDLLEKKGDYTGAESLYRQALEARERAHGKRHPSALVPAINLARVRVLRCDWKAAEPLCRWTQEATEAALGEEHPHAVVALLNLARLLQGQGNRIAAEPMFQRVLERFERTLGDGHTETLTAAFHYACFLEDGGNDLAAENLFRRAVDGFSQVRGDAHPDTLANVRRLLMLVAKKRDLVEAESLTRRWVFGCTSLLGSEHPRTLEALTTLGLLLRARGDFGGAENLLRQVLEVQERDAGPETPDTLKTRVHLADTLEGKGEFLDAARIQDLIRDYREHALGPDHAETLRSLVATANALFRGRDYGGAEPLYRRAIDGLERTVGPTHPETVAAAVNLVSLLLAAGDAAAAEPLVRKTAEAVLESSGAEQQKDPHLLDVLNKYDAVLERLGLSREARMRRLVELAEPFGIQLDVAEEE